MKILIKTIVLGALLIGSISISAQAPKSPVWAVDFVKTNDGQQSNFLKFIDLNWSKARQSMKDGIINSYQVLSVPADDKKQWDVLLITEYTDQAGYEQREPNFQEYFKKNPVNLVNGMTSRQMSEIKLSSTFNRPVSSEIGEIMLKTQDANAEIAAARIPLENYLKGHETGNSEYMKKAFYTEGKLIFIREGKYTTRTFEEYIAGMNGGKPAPDEARRRRSIESIDVSGNAAIGKIILDYPNVKFVDYMTLLKIDGEWKIVNKSFYAEPKTQK